MNTTRRLWTQLAFAAAAVLTCSWTATAQTGACCTNLGGCSITMASGCVGTSNAFQGVGTTCTPSPCLAWVGACCAQDTTCTLTAAAGCIAPATFTSLGTACSPTNPCLITSGACCIGLTCSFSPTPAACTGSGGAFFPNLSCATFTCERPPVVISQIYCSGGTPGAQYKYDYVELHNRGSSSVTMTDWTLHFGAQSTSTFPTRAIINGTIPAGGYFLIQLNSTDLTNGVDLPVTPDLIPAQNVNLDIGAGRLALRTFNSPLASGCQNPWPITIADFVGYGPTGAGAPSCSEGPTPYGTNAQGGVVYAWFRKGLGCQDTDINRNDFMLPGVPAPRNSLSPVYVCGTTVPGACCIGEVCTVEADAATCTGMTGNFQGEGTLCTPNNPCLTPRGACCNGSTCTIELQANCLSPAVFNYGFLCAPDPCVVACCTLLGVCTIENQQDCVSPRYRLQYTACTPVPCSEPPEVVQNGDIAIGLSVATAQQRDAIPQIRGAGSATPTRVGTWNKYAFLQGVKFDNHNGVQHNAAGNLLGLNFGTTGSGGSIYNLQTTTGDPTAGQLIFTFVADPNPQPFGLQRTRMGGMSVSPNNDRIGFLGYDSARAYVLSYVPGATVGTGAGSSVDGGAQTDNNTFLLGFNLNQGTAWLDNDNMIAWVRSEFANTLKLYTIPVSGSGAGITLGTPVEQLSIVDIKPNGSRFLSIAHNPQLIPGYIFLGSSDFQGLTSNTLYVVDITGMTWTVVKEIELTSSLQTGREIAIGPDLDLYLNQYAGSDTMPSDPILDKIDLNSNNDTVVTPAEIAALSDNSSVNFYLRGSFPASNFSGFDIAIEIGACCDAAGLCSIALRNNCTGTFQGSGTNCSTSPCPAGACCVGAACTINVTGAACQLNGGTFDAGNSCTITPGPPHNFCCPTNFDRNLVKDVADIFAGLAGYFANDPAMDWDGSGLPVTLGDFFLFFADWFVPC